MYITRRHLTFGASAFAVGAGFGLASCGDDQPKKPNGKSLRMQASWLNDAEFLGYFVALDPEFAFYEKVGLNVEYFSGGPQVIPETAILSGKADLALATPETTARYILRDKVDLRIIGAQYQKNPIGIVSLAKSGIRSPADLRGKKLAVPPVNQPTAEALFKLNHIDIKDVELVPYTYDPRILINGTADASTDFVTNVPYVIRKLGGDPYSFLLYDYGLTLYNDIVVVRGETLNKKFEELVLWMMGSIRGWQESFRDGDFARIPKKFENTRFKDNGRTIDNEIEFNRNQAPLMLGERNLFEMTVKGIQGNINALKVLNFGIPNDTRVWEAAQERLGKSAK
jgi:ABC-type nitrate/sulfonate/bicarbonate transport system substrate-binding protein